MAGITVSKSISSEVLRQELKSFGAFSELEISEGNNQTIIFSEVSVGERLRRLIFKDKKYIEDRRRKSRRFLMNFAGSRPDIGKILGSSIVTKKFWTASDFRNHLIIKTDVLKSEEKNGLFRIPQNSQIKFGLTDAKLSEIEADKFITWSFHTPEPGKINLPYVSSNEDSEHQKTISVVYKNNPDEQDLRSAYQTALSAASGHVVLSPIYDVPVHEVITRQPEYAKKSRFHDIQSDNNLRILIEEIDKAIRDNTNITKVTIARGDTPDEWFLSRVLAQRAIFEKNKADANKILGTGLASMPPSLNLIVQDVGGEYDLRVKSENAVPKIKETGLSQVSLYAVDPGTVTADTTFLTFSSVDRCATALYSADMMQFPLIRDLIFDSSSGISEEVQTIFSRTQRQWGISALELPPFEMPSSKLYAINASDLGSMTHDSAKKFFTEHLQRLEGRVVLEITGNDVLDKAMWEALNELNSKFQEKKLECVLASSDEATIDRFLTDIIQPDLDIDGDEDDPFDYFGQLKNKTQHLAGWPPR